MRLLRAAAVLGVAVLLCMTCDMSHVSAEELSPVKNSGEQQVGNTGEKEPLKQSGAQSDSSPPVSSAQRPKSPQEDATQRQHVQESTPKTSVPESSDTGESHDMSHDRSQRDAAADEGKPSQQPQQAGSHDANVRVNRGQSAEVGVGTPHGATQTAGGSSINTKEQAASGKEQAASELKKEQAASELKKEQAASELKKEQAASELKKEQAASELKKEQAASELKKEQAASELKKEQAASELKKEQAASELKKEQAASELKKEQAASELKKEQAALELKKEQAALELKKEHAASELKKEQAALELKKEQAASELKKEQAASELKKEHAASELKKEQAASELKKEQAASELKKEQAASELKKEQAASELKKEQAASEIKKEQAASEIKKEQAISEKKKEQAASGKERATRDNRQVLQEETAPPPVDPLNDDADDGLSDLESDDEEAKTSDVGSTTGNLHAKRTEDDHRYIRNFREQLLSEEPDIDAGNPDLSDPKRFAHRHAVYKSMGVIDPINYGQIDLDSVTDIFTKRSEDGTLRTIVLFLPEPSGRRKMHIHRQRVLDSGDVWEDVEEHYEIEVAPDDMKQGMGCRFVLHLLVCLINVFVEKISWYYSGPVVWVWSMVCSDHYNLLSWTHLLINI